MQKLSKLSSFSISEDHVISISIDASSFLTDSYQQDCSPMPERYEEGSGMLTTYVICAFALIANQIVYAFRYSTFFAKFEAHVSRRTLSGGTTLLWSPLLFL
ncbi:hypothetical protein QJS10_CPA16g01314 [Acorus calamus]|uniref:Uncharacterized protein n=1 Tax=Acorus calamus TaxID=4465 RepID=A0AAV9D208_ACOCL|nr:hypothetical protein QJS10_CPA16g01314 [Acorus calamus]